MSTSLDAEIEPFAAAPQPFPNWPPNSGGYPNLNPELGPVTNPYPYGTPQTANISIANPAPPYLAVRYPQSYGVGNNGQNQGGSYQLPKSTKPMEVGPIAAPPSISQIQPPPIMGPGPQGQTPFSAPTITRTFPAGNYIDGLGTQITPTGVTRVIGGLGN
jgi:hypothetical protein